MHYIFIHIIHIYITLFINVFLICYVINSCRCESRKGVHVAELFDIKNYIFTKSPLILYHAFNKYIVMCVFV